MKIAIIGFGAFGRFVAHTLSEFSDIYVLDKDESLESRYKPLKYDEIDQMDCLVLAVPLDAYKDVLSRIKPLLREDTLIVDVCSVKTKSRDIVFGTIPDHRNILICHPLFGPQSAVNGLEGHDLVVTDKIGDKANSCVAFLEKKLKLKIHSISAEQHDRIMAYVHVLTFFVARGLSEMSRPEIPFQTPSYDLISSLVDFDRTHTEELFQTIQKGNPYADEVRQELIRTFNTLEESLKS